MSSQMPLFASISSHSKPKSHSPVIETIATWNVNGIRACGSKGLFQKWFEEVKADVVCIQEAKAFPGQVNEELNHPLGYHSFWNPAKKPGYSGVTVYSKHEPLSVREGFQNPTVPDADTEGRVITVEFKNVTVINAYFPNSQREHTRLPFKEAFCQAMIEHCEAIRAAGKNLVLCGDFNIAHQEIDLRNPKQNMNNAGFLPEERAWMDHYLDVKKYVDVFRHFEKGGGHYTWWSYRPGVREKNIGWRLDYHVVNPEFIDRAESASIHCEARGSDHCPVLLKLRD